MEVNTLGSILIWFSSPMQWTQYISVEERKARRNRDIENQQIGFEEVAELERKQSKALPEALSDQQCYLTMSKTRFK